MGKSKKVFPIIEIALLGIIVYLLIQNINLFNKQISLEEEVENKTYTYAQIEEEITSVEEEVYEEDTLEYIEKIARDEYGMVKPKEIVFKDQGI